MASTFKYAGSKTPYIDMYNDYKAQQNSIRDAYKKQIEADQSAAIAQSNAEYDNSARQNYINYMQSQKRLPSELNALGIRGGASESSLTRLGTTYGSNVASNESARNNALAGIRQTYAQKLAEYDEENDNKLMQAYLTAVENQLKWEQENGGGSGGGGRRYGGRSYGSSGSGGSTQTTQQRISNANNAIRSALKNTTAAATSQRSQAKKRRTIKGDFYKSKGHVKRIGR